MPKKSFLPIIRELVRCYQAFESHSAGHIRTLGLTPAQFDIVATLGNTDGMSFKQLGEKTLITKGTLTGVVDRLVLKRLVCRTASPNDGRSQIVCLTSKGESLFEDIFPAHLGHLRRAFGAFSGADLQQTESVLRSLRVSFERAREET
ncbi:MAG: MarR family transcriptional regulator [Proteobacteria bacterium]|nr:MarR family transcriptional regulator [Pseudomonadota bacterium]